MPLDRGYGKGKNAVAGQPKTASVPGKGKTGTFLKNPPGDPGTHPSRKRRRHGK